MLPRSMILAILNDEDARIFTTPQECAEYIARGEIEPRSVLRVDDDIPPRPISETIAILAWSAMVDGFNPDTDTAPRFISDNVPGFFDILDEMKQESAPYPRMSQGEFV